LETRSINRRFVSNSANTSSTRVFETESIFAFFAFSFLDNVLIKMNSALQRRTFQDLPPSYQDAIRHVALDPRNVPNLAGSVSYWIQAYPSDIDMNETYVGKGSASTTAHWVAKRVGAIARKISQTAGMFLLDFKSGVDVRYALPVGKMVRGCLQGYDAAHLRQKITQLYQAGLLTPEEWTGWSESVVDAPTMSQYIKMIQTVRTKWVVRWTSDELQRGVKTLPLQKELKLVTALRQRTVVKIDIALVLNGRYTELSNWYILKYKRGGRTVPLTQGLKGVQESLLDDIVKYSSVEINTMKAAKRAWSYATLTQRNDLIGLLVPLFKSPISLLGQIKSEYETLETLAKQLSAVQGPKRGGLQRFHARLTELEMRCTETLLMFPPSDVSMVDRQNVISVIEAHKKANTFADLALFCGLVSTTLKQLVNKTAAAYATDVGITRKLDALVSEWLICKA
jgi:hypothetical protein